MEVAPLDKTISGIDTAAQLIDFGKYYEGNQALKEIEDGLRFDVADVNSGPEKATAPWTKQLQPLAVPRVEIRPLPPPCQRIIPDGRQGNRRGHSGVDRCAD